MKRYQGLNPWLLYESPWLLYEPFGLLYKPTFLLHSPSISLKKLIEISSVRVMAPFRSSQVRFLRSMR